MLRKTIIALATTAIVAGASMGGAQAHGHKFGFGHGHGHGHGHHNGFFKKGFGFVQCKIVKRKIVIGHTKFGHPIYRFKRVKVCF